MKKQIESWHYLNNVNLKKRLIHGGAKSKGKRKEFRPLSTKDPIHLVLKSAKARGTYNLLHNRHRQNVEDIIRKQAKRFFIQVKKYVNVGNHLHLEIKIPARKEFQQFLKSVTCLIARKVTGARRGHKFGRFWDLLAFTRVLKTYSELEILRRYFFANYLEATINKSARIDFLSAWYGHSNKAPPN